MFRKNIWQNICCQNRQMSNSKREGEFATRSGDHEFTNTPQTSDVVGCFRDSKKRSPRDGIVSIVQLSPPTFSMLLPDCKPCLLKIAVPLPLHI